jgi:hypothetical protein
MSTKKKKAAPEPVSVMSPRAKAMLDSLNQTALADPSPTFPTSPRPSDTPISEDDPFARKFRDAQRRASLEDPSPEYPLRQVIVPAREVPSPELPKRPMPPKPADFWREQRARPDFKASEERARKILESIRPVK